MNTEDAWNQLLPVIRQYDTKSISEVSGVCVSTINHWYNGKYRPRYGNLLAVAHAVGCKVVLTIEK